MKFSFTGRFFGNPQTCIFSSNNIFGGMWSMTLYGRSTNQWYTWKSTMI